VILYANPIFAQDEKPQKESKQIINVGFGANYYFTPKNGTYVPRYIPNNFYDVPNYVGYEIQTFVSPYLECNYYYKFKNNIIVGGGINYIRQKEVRVSDKDSVAIYKPYPSRAFSLKTTSYSNIFQLKLEAGYTIKRFSFLIGTSYDAIRLTRKTYSMDDGSVSKFNSFYYFNYVGPLAIIIPRSVSVQYLLLDKDLKTNLYIRYLIDEKLLMAGLRFNFNLKKDEK